jgi:probable phosphoglycerate mutase
VTDPQQRVDPTMLVGVTGVTELVLVRHAKQAVSDEFLDLPVEELLDPPLSDLGRRQAEAVAHALARDTVDAVCSSTSTRARETAEVIGAMVGVPVPVRVVEGIEEFGMFRDLPPDKSPRQALGDVQFAGFQHRWSRTRQWRAWPASEPVGEFLDRVINGIEGIAALHNGKRVVIVSHGGSINAYLGDILGTPDDMFFNPAHASISRVLVKHDRRVVATMNELQHLRGAPDLLTF